MSNEHFDAVVVGSGFGGSTVGYRLRQRGLSVCLLERGRAYPPGTYPRGPAGLRDNFWDPSEGLHGMFQIWSFGGLEAVVSSGLGGGSLIYANVLLRKDEKWFVQDRNAAGGEYWPVTRKELDPHYDAVEEMLAPQRYPFDKAPYSLTAKTRALQKAAGKLGLTWDVAPLGVIFGNPGRPPTPGDPVVEPAMNLHGRPRQTCLLCGECDIGCNYGSKNTLDYTYLSAAKHQGLIIRTRSEVRAFGPRDGGGFTVRYVEHAPEREGKKTETSKLPVTEITADRLILSAGSLGTTYLLLKNRGNFPALSRRLGTRFSGNGDLLGQVVPAKQTGARRSVPLDPTRGPVITSYMRLPDQLDGTGANGRGAYIEDGGHPEFLAWLAEATQVPGIARRLAGFAWRRLKARFSESPQSAISSEVRALLGACELSSCSMPLLGMGRDVPDGTMRLKGGYLQVDWNITSSADYFERLRGTMKQIARSLEAEFRDNPAWYLRRVISAHPLGGCPMGDDESTGVVDPHGRVFNYPGLYIADGSVMPGPVGTNPSLTIAALADRTADAILADRDRR